jgi:uncharacterized protein YjdB
LPCKLGEDDTCSTAFPLPRSLDTRAALPRRALGTKTKRRTLRSLGLAILGVASLVTLATCGDDGTPTSPGPGIAPVPTTATQGAPAITHTRLTSGNKASNQRTYTTASISPAANTLITLAVLGHRGSGANPSPEVSGGGMSSWTEVATVTFDVLGTPLKRLTIFRAMSAAPGSGQITIRFNSTASNCQWIVSQWSGVVTSGANGADAIGQIGSNRADAGTGLTVALAPFGNPNNVGYGAFGVRSQSLAVTPGAGFTEIAEHASGESVSSDLQAEWATNDNTIDASWTSRRSGALGIEIKAANAPVAVASVEVTPASADVQEGATLQLTATPKDALGNPLTGRAVTWATTDAAVVTVSQSGLVTGVGSGAATVSATSEGQSGTAALTVVPVPVATVAVDPADASVGTGATLQLTATPRSAAGNPLTGRDVTWTTSDEAVATVSETGLVTGVSLGNATITATSEGQSGKAAVAVVAPVASMDVTPASAEVQAGQTLQLSATPRDAAGDPLTGRVVNWGSSDEAVAKVSATGLVTGVAAGSATITATSEGKSGSSAVTVTSPPTPVATVQVSPSVTSVVEGRTIQLVATLKDANGIVLSGRAVTWSSGNGAVATVNGNGLVTAVGAGSVTIIATSEGKSGSSAVTVTRAAVATVEVTPATAAVEVAAKVQLTATPKDIDGNPLSGRAVTWTSSQVAVAGVKPSGLVTALSEGSATITATSEGTSGTAAITVTPPSPGAPVFLVGAGDIAKCGALYDEATALLLDDLPGTVFLAGDNAYEDGSPEQFATCYEPSWGRHKARTRPSPGNHDYHMPNASGYFGYFGAAAGDPTKGYYSYDVGEWHVMVLNSELPTTLGSAQEQWLRADLAASTKACQVAYWHHPMLTTSSGRSYRSSIKPLWEALYAAGAELIINAHDHSYQRYAPQRPDGVLDAGGIRQITVGTGGAGLYDFGPEAFNVEVRNNVAHGVLQLTLRSDGYEWKFLPVAGQTFTDAGSGTCHGAGQLPPNQAPVARVGGPYRSERVVVFDGRASTDPDNNTPLTYAWDFGDGTTGTGAAPDHSYAIDRVYNVTLVVTDALGMKSAAATTTATIENIAPAVNAGPDVFLRPGESFDLSATFSDPGEDDGPWTYTIDWGDGATESGPPMTQVAPIAASHAYAALGTYVVRVTVTDKDGGAGTDALTARVTESASSTIAHVLLTSGNHVVNQSVYTTASISPAPNTLVTLAVLGHRSGGANPSPTVSGGGMSSWTEVATVTFETVGTPLKRLTIFRAMSAAPGSGPITITFNASVSNSQWIVSQWSGVATSGANGADAIGQIGSNRGDAVSGLAVPLGAFGNPSNVGYGVFGVRSQVLAVTPGAGFTEIAEHPSAESPGSDLQAEWATNVNTIAATWATAIAGGAFGIEIKAQTGGP